MNTPSVSIDDLSIRPFHIKITALTFGAHFTDGYILGLIGMVFTLITPQLELNSFWQGAIGSAALLGLFLGSLFFGYISDSLGRQKIFCISFILIGLGSFLQFFADSALLLFLCRVMIGIGLGGDYTVGHALLAEFLPKKHRGTILGSFSVIWTFGYVAATFVAKWAIDINLAGSDTWRYLLTSSAIPAIIILIARMGTPESPRWLVNRGRVKEAQEVVHRFLGKDVTLGDEANNEGTKKSNGYAVLFRKEYIKRTLFNCIFFTCIVMPYFAIYTFLPMILQVMNLSNDFTTEMILNCMLILGALIGIGCTIKFSRRGFLINAFIILTINLIVLVLIPSTLSWLLVLVFSLFTLTLSAVSNLVGVFPAESFPTEIRSSGIGLATAVSRLGSAISTFLLPLSVVGLGMNSTMLILAGILCFGTIISYLWAPETKGLSLAKACKTEPTHELDNEIVNEVVQEI